MTDADAPASPRETHAAGRGGLRQVWHDWHHDPVDRFGVVLIFVVATIVVTVVFGLDGNGLKLVGDLPSGFPAPRLPETDWDDISAMFGARVAIW